MAEIKIVTIDELRQMNDQEGLILQGCGGDLQEGVDGINELFAQAGILQAGSAWKAKAVRSFQYDGLTNLLFPFADVSLDVENLAKENHMPKSANVILLGAAAPFLKSLDAEVLRESVGRIFASKGEEVVQMNYRAFDIGHEYVKQLKF